MMKPASSKHFDDHTISDTRSFCSLSWAAINPEISSSWVAANLPEPSASFDMNFSSDSKKLVWVHYLKKLFEVYRVSIQANQLEIVVYENSIYHYPDH